MDQSLGEDRLDIHSPLILLGARSRWISEFRIESLGIGLRFEGVSSAILKSELDGKAHSAPEVGGRVERQARQIPI